VTNNTMHEASWELPLAAWAEWPGEHGVELPKLDFVEPMLRRRLSVLAKMSLWAAHQCAHGLSDVRMIYASQHGEIVRTTEMLDALVAGEPLSPTAFSMSVLNASIGLYSIITSNTAPATAIAAGEETLGYALLEAHGQLSSKPAQPVLVIYADETVPDIWGTDDSASPHAIALLLHSDASTRIRCSRTTVSGTGFSASPTTQARTFGASLRTGESAHWDTNGSRWQWQSLPA
jgi:hypothetical protein